MIGVPGKGFVMLSQPKAGSTSLVRSIESEAEISLRMNPGLKHLNCRQFHRVVVPLLRRGGYYRKDYEVCTLFREPIEWLESWWRYRRRPELADSDPERFTGEQTFEEFALDYLERPNPMRGRPSKFVAMSDDLDIGVDRIFRLEAPEVWQAYLHEKLGQHIDFKTANVSTERAAPELTRSTRKKVREHLAPEYDIYDHLVDDGYWCPPHGYVAGRGATD